MSLPIIKIECPKGNGAIGISAEINGFKITGLQEVNINLKTGCFANVTFTVACKLDIDAIRTMPNIITVHSGNDE